MDPLQFCYWLQGFAELNNGVPPNEEQWKAIRDHLQLCFLKKTPEYNFRGKVGETGPVTGISGPTIVNPLTTVTC